SLGYSPMPINLVNASFDQIKKIPGVVVQNVTVSQCNNPTFSPDGHNVLADTAPQPQACDKQGPTQCATGTGGASKTTTKVKPSATGPSNNAAGGASGGAGANETAAGATPATTCDPDTGQCTGAAATGGGAGATTDATAVPTVLAADKGWG